MHKNTKNPLKIKGFQCVFHMVEQLWRYRPDLNWGMRVLQTLALPLGHGTIYENRNAGAFLFYFIGAGDEARTRYLHLGKVALYRMSYTRISVLY